MKNPVGRPRHTILYTEQYKYTWNKKTGQIKIWARDGTKQGRLVMMRHEKQMRSMIHFGRFVHMFEHNLLYIV